MTPDDVLDFWFGLPGSPERGKPREVWFKKSEVFDQAVRKGFSALYELAADGRLEGLDLSGIDWLIAGGESGPGYRPVNVEWIRDRILSLSVRPDYMPRLHFDTYGTIGVAFGGDLNRIADYLFELCEAAKPFALRIEHPIDAGSREAQISTYARLRRLLAERHIPVEIVADEWCNTLEDIRLFVDAEAVDMIHVKMPDLGGVDNTIEALLYIKAAKMGAFCGGACNETDISARVSAHVAMACGADQLLAKPGMGVDEGLMIVGNEMARIQALASAHLYQRNRHV